MDKPAYTAPSPPKGERDALKQLAVPVSPIAESVNNDQVPSFPVGENLTKTSLEIQTSTRVHLAKLPGVTLTPVESNKKVPAPIVAKLNAKNSDYLKSRATITQLNKPTKALTMSDNDSMDLDSTFIAAVEKRESETDSDAPKAKKTTMQALASAYKTRVVETINKLVLQKGGGPINLLPSLEGNIETEFFNKVVKVSDKPVAKPSYAAAPLLTLKQLMPEGIVEDGLQDFESIPLDQTFRAECIEFVVMIKPLPKPGSNPDISWELPDGTFFDMIMNEAFSDFIEPYITRMDGCNRTTGACPVILRHPL